MTAAPSRSGGASGGSGDGRLAAVVAVVLTHLRPQLATDVTRTLIDAEGLRPDQVIVVVNGEGGLDAPDLEDRVQMVRLGRNTGPAGGFRAGLEEAFRSPHVRWAYLCEDDVGLFDLPVPRLAPLVEAAERRAGSAERLGAVVAYGRRFVGRGAHTVNVVPDTASAGWTPVDVACWGATLVSRSVVDAGVLPDPEWFFGLEDFDFFCRVRAAGLSVVLDETAAWRVADQQTLSGREDAHKDRRPTDDAEAWRAYYHARNSIMLARRHGRPSWYVWHLAYSARHLQKARSGAERVAIAHGLWDGALGRTGQHPRYHRTLGEHTLPGPPGGIRVTSKPSGEPGSA